MLFLQFQYDRLGGIAHLTHDKVNILLIGRECVIISVVVGGEAGEKGRRSVISSPPAHASHSCLPAMILCFLDPFPSLNSQQQTCHVTFKYIQQTSHHLDVTFFNIPSNN